MHYLPTLKNSDYWYVTLISESLLNTSMVFLTETSQNFKSVKCPCVDVSVTVPPCSIQSH